MYCFSVTGLELFILVIYYITILKQRRQKKTFDNFSENSNFSENKINSQEQIDLNKEKI